MDLILWEKIKTFRFIWVLVKIKSQHAMINVALQYMLLLLVQTVGIGGDETDYASDNGGSSIDGGGGVGGDSNEMASKRESEKRTQHCIYEI